MEFRFFSSFSDLPLIPAEPRRIMEAESFFLSEWWFQTIINGALDAGDEIAIGCLTDFGKTIGLLPCRFRKRFGPFEGHSLMSLTGPYACLFRPLIYDLEREVVIARFLGREIGRRLSRRDSIWLDAVDKESPTFDGLCAGLRDAGFIAMQYDHFGNWSEILGGRTFQQYISSRDGALQEILRRKGRVAKRNGAEFEIVSEPDEVAIREYELVYSRSWKVAEPYPQFHRLLMRNAAAQGALRLGICRIEGAPVAAQLWIVWHRTATVLKLAHDEAFNKMSIGSVLTGYMIEELMKRDGIGEIDFGRGDDLYKRLWAERRRQRVGLIAANPRSIAGMFRVVRQSLPNIMRSRKV